MTKEYIGVECQLGVSDLSYDNPSLAAFFDKSRKPGGQTEPGQGGSVRYFLAREQESRTDLRISDWLILWCRGPHLQWRTGR